MPNTPRMQWPYPSENQDPWYEAIRAFFEAADASGYAQRENAQFVITGGGEVTLETSTGVLAWTEAIEIFSAYAGFNIVVEAGQITLDEGQIAYLTVTRAPSRNITTTLVVASQVPTNDNAIIFCIRRGNFVYFRNGAVVEEGGSISPLAGGGGGGGGGGSPGTPGDGRGSGWIRIIDVQPNTISDNVFDKVFQGPDTDTSGIANAAIIQSATSSSATVDLLIRSSYPRFEVRPGSNPAVTGTFSAAIDDTYAGTVTVTTVSGEDIEAIAIDSDGDRASTDTCVVTVEAGPVITDLFFDNDADQSPGGPYPTYVHPTAGVTSQTALKVGDTYKLTGRADKALESITLGVHASDVYQSQTITFGSGGDPNPQPVPANTFFTVTGTVTSASFNTTQTRFARVYVTDQDSTNSATRDTNFGGGTTEGEHVVKVNNRAPSVALVVTDYPGTQMALKNTEQAEITLTDNTVDWTTGTGTGGLGSGPDGALDVLVYTMLLGELTFLSTTPDLVITPYTNPVFVERLGGTYNITTPNFQLVTLLGETGRTATSTVVVNIAHATPTITLDWNVGGAKPRLISGGGTADQYSTDPQGDPVGSLTSIPNQDHNIDIVSDQKLLMAPTTDPAPMGTFVAGVFADVSPPNGVRWRDQLRVLDTVTKGTYTVTNLSATNLAGIVVTSFTGSADYILGGFFRRSVAFTAFSQNGTINTGVVTYSKLTQRSGAGGPISSSGFAPYFIATSTSNPAIRNATQGDTSNLQFTYTVDPGNPGSLPINSGPVTVYWNDFAAASSNSATTYLVDLEEIA